MMYLVLLFTCVCSWCIHVFLCFAKCNVRHRMRQRAHLVTSIAFAQGGDCRAINSLKKSEVCKMNITTLNGGRRIVFTP